MRLGFVLLAAIFLVPAYAQTPALPQLTCTSGPVTKHFGGTDWLVYACNDNRSVVIVSAPGSPAMPFYFVFLWNQGNYRLHGEGNGKKSATDAAYKELSQFSVKEIEALLDQAAQ